MHTNFNLNFHHKINFEVFHDRAPVTVDINLNGSLIQSKTYTPGLVHKEKLIFDREVLDGAKNTIQFIFTGEQESSKKYLKIKNISVQQYKVNVMKNYYTPIINKEWWNTLTDSKKKYYKDVIYINNNGIFGWYGISEYEYYSGIDKASRYLCDAAAEDRLLTMTPRFVYNDPATITLPWDKDEN